MRCDTCKQESPIVLRVVVDKAYNRSLSRPLFNCPACYSKKERSKKTGAQAAQSGGRQQA